jgi:hypothetical protein
MESPAQPCARRTSKTLPPLKIGARSNLTSRSVFLSHCSHINVLETDIETLQKHDSVHAIEDALARISHLQPVQLGPSGSSEASQQVLIEVLPPVLVLHLKRFLYDVAAGGIVKISKPVQFAPELEIPLGTIFSFVSFVLAVTKNHSWLGRNHGVRF